MYNVLLVKGAGAGSGNASTGRGRIALQKTKPTPETKPLVDAIGAELAAQGGSWDKWLKSVAPAQELMRKRAKSGSKEIKATAGAHGFLFFKKSLEYASAGDFEKQRRGKNPLPVIVEFKQALAARGVDFLFVPVPTKEELFPDELDPSLKPFVGKVIQPYSRKFLLSLAAAGVETVDLLPPFLAARSSENAAEPLYQKQDTHWTHRGLALAARILSERVRRYPWYAQLSRHAEPFSTKPAAFTRFGDLHSRLADAEKPKYQPESLLAQQVLRRDGQPYEDDPDSPIVMLGDSYTGVYQLTDAEHAGVSAHLAKGVSYPVDLVMSYGGGPNVRNKLLSRGADDLNHKKLVIWLMTARDLYDYWEDWEPLVAK
jgi:alginate O-acetyltransferase complex protein AlgJ